MWVLWRGSRLWQSPWQPDICRSVVSSEMPRSLSYLAGLTVPMNTAPVSTATSRPASMPASIVSADVSGSPFTLFARELGERGHAVAASEPFGAADHEVAVHERRPAGVPRRGLDRVIVDRRDIALRRGRLRRDHIEVLHLGVRDGGERVSGLGERHPHLDAVDPHELIAGSPVGLLDAIDQPCSLSLG